MTKATLAVLTAAAVIAATATAALAAPPDYDGGFGTGGIAIAPPANNNSIGVGAAVALDHAGNVLVAGLAGAPSATAGGQPTGHAAVARFTPAGVADTTFGTNGTAVSTLGGFSIATGVAEATTGEVLVAADSFTDATSASSGKASVLRLTPQGAPDNTFGSAGTASVTPAPALVVGITTDSTGSVLVGGSTIGATPSASTGFVERFTSTGAPDSTFGTNGVLTLAAPSQVAAISTTSDGHILIAGNSEHGLSVWRLTKTGTADTTFGGSAGVAKVPLPPASVSGLLAEPDGSTVVVADLPFEPVVAKISSAGQIDPAFGDAGVSVVDVFGGGAAAGVALTPGGDIALAGLGGTTGTWLARLHSDGTPDRTFAPGGRASPAPPSGGLFLATRGVVVQTDGKVVVAGTGVTETTPSGGGAPTVTAGLSAARFLGGSGVATPPPNTAGRISGPDRLATAIAASGATFASAGHEDPARLPTSDVVLVDADAYPDALVGTPLAASRRAPLLLTHTATLAPEVMAEIQRVLGPPDSSVEVTIVGGTFAVSAAVESAITAAGYQVKRIAGGDRFETAVDVAKAVGPLIVFEATGTNFPDGVAAGAAAASVHGAVLLTNGSTQATATATYLQANPSLVFAVGGAAAAADPSATSIVGSDRYDTAAKLARAVFTTPAAVGVATGSSFADALSGGARAAEYGAPLLLTDPSTLSPPTATYLQTNAKWIDTADVFGGTLAISDATLASIQQAITETAQTAGGRGYRAAWTAAPAFNWRMGPDAAIRSLLTCSYRSARNSTATSSCR
ncbi:MAG: cell wall-binding repeat-containing protein [Acidimicrobiales bacterium]